MMDKTELTGAQERRYPGMRAEMVGKMCSIKPNTGARKDRVQLEGQTNLTRACLREKSKTKAWKRRLIPTVEAPECQTKKIISSNRPV